MKYVLYCRKSTDTEDKQVLSLESQENELIRLAKSQNLEVVKVLREAMSAKAVGRPVFNQVLKMVVQGHADGILCWKLDRLARNMVDGGQVMDLMQKNVIKEIRTYESVHLANDNVLMLAVHFGMANQFVRDLSANVKRGNRAKLERGEWPNHAPLGYLNDRATKTIVVDPIRSHYLRKIFDMYTSGSHSFKSISETLYRDGLRTSTGRKVLKSNIQHILSLRFYTGVMERDGRLYQGNHQPLISKQQFDDAQYVMSGRSRPKTQHLFFPLRGFLKCESCGCALTSSLKKGHHYYYCTNGRKACTQHKSYMRENYLYERVGELFDKLAFSERKIELMYRSAKEKMEQDGNSAEQLLQHLQKRLDGLQERETRLLDTYLAQQITKDLYDRKVSEIQHERLDLQRQIRETNTKRPAFTLEPVKEIFLEGSRAKKEFLDAKDEKKRRIIEKLLWNLSIENKTVAQVQYKTPFHILAKVPKNADFSTLLTAWFDVGTALSRWD